MKVASQGLRRIRVAGIPYAAIRGGLCQRVAFRTHPAQTAEDKSVEQPWEQPEVFAQELRAAFKQLR